MKVLYIAHYFLPNIAAGVTTKEIIKMLLQKGHKVTLIAPTTYVTNDPTVRGYPEGFELKPASTVIPRRIAKQSKLASMLIATIGYLSVFITGLRCWKRDGPFKAIIVQYHPFHLAPLASCLLSLVIEAPLLVKIHDLIPGSPSQSKLELFYGKLLARINRLGFTRASCILSMGTEVNQILIEIFGVDASKLVVLPNSVDLVSPSTEEINELRSSLGLEEKRVVFFMASAFEDRGLDVLLRALEQLRKERIVLVVVGRCGEAYEELAHKLHINKNVVFVGEIAHQLVPTYIHMADICVGPLISRLMWFGLIPRKALECMACGKPIIVARGTVPKDLAVDGISAVLVDSTDGTQIASAIMSLLNDGSLREQIGKGALTIISERYATRKLADKLDDALLLCTHKDV